MENAEYRKLLSDFHDIATDLKKDIAAVSEKVTRINTIMEGAGNGGIIADMKRIEAKVDKMEREFKAELEKRDTKFEKVNAKVLTWGGAFLVLVALANFLLPKLFG